MKENYATEIQYQVKLTEQDEGEIFATYQEVKNYLFTFVPDFARRFRIKIIPKKKIDIKI